MSTLVFDIETIPQNEEILLARAPEFKPAANLKDPEKIAASIADKRSRYIQDAALDWKTAEVVLIGMWDGSEFCGISYDTEKETLETFLEILDDLLSRGDDACGHNIKGFDLPMIVNRARVHKIKVPQNILTLNKGRAYWHNSIYDTMEILSFGKSFEGNGVEDVAKALGLPGKTGKGSDFPALWKLDREAAIAYNKQDVLIETEIARFCGIL